MARQKGIIKLKGTVGDITFYQTADGHMAREKTALDGNRIAIDPAFVRTRENNTEFAEAAKAGKLIRDAVNPLMATAKDRRVVSRLLKLMSKIRTLDATNVRGLRTVGTAIALPSAKTLLKGFNFNDRSHLAAVLLNQYSLNTGTGVISMNALTPANEIDQLTAATHFSIKGGWAKIDFVNKTYELKLSNIVNLALNSAPSNVILTPTALPAGAGTSLYLLQVEYFQLVNGVQYSLKNGAYNALSVIEVI
ncbi:MAG: hypothetical protein HYX39_12245 [Bacteroidetes bacterium]|nr:hypothetical protein [Bacteroidota bacterium]